MAVALEALPPIEQNHDGKELFTQCFALLPHHEAFETRSECFRAAWQHALWHAIAGDVLLAAMLARGPRTLGLQLGPRGLPDASVQLCSILVWRSSEALPLQTHQQQLRALLKGLRWPDIEAPGTFTSVYTGSETTCAVTHLDAMDMAVEAAMGYAFRQDTQDALMDQVPTPGAAFCHAELYVFPYSPCQLAAGSLACERFCMQCHRLYNDRLCTSVMCVACAAPLTCEAHGTQTVPCCECLGVARMRCTCCQEALCEVHGRERLVRKTRATPQLRDQEQDARLRNAADQCWYQLLTAVHPHLNRNRWERGSMRVGVKWASGRVRLLLERTLEYLQLDAGGVSAEMRLQVIWFLWANRYIRGPCAATKLLDLVMRPDDKQRGVLKDLSEVQRDQQRALQAQVKLHGPHWGLCAWCGRRPTWADLQDVIEGHGVTVHSCGCQHQTCQSRFCQALSMPHGSFEDTLLGDVPAMRCTRCRTLFTWIQEEQPPCPSLASLLCPRDDADKAVHGN